MENKEMVKVLRVMEVGGEFLSEENDCEKERMVEYKYKNQYGLVMLDDCLSSKEIKLETNNVDEIECLFNSNKEIFNELTIKPMLSRQGLKIEKLFQKKWIELEDILFIENIKSELDPNVEMDVEHYYDCMVEEIDDFDSCSIEFDGECLVLYPGLATDFLYDEQFRKNNITKQICEVIYDVEN